MRCCALTLLLFWLTFAGNAAADAGSTRSACDGARLLCLFHAGAVNCSGAASAAAVTAEAADTVTFAQDYPEVQPSQLSMHLEVQELSSFSVADLQGLVTCFPLAYGATVHLVAGRAECHLLPGSLDPFEGMRRLSLRLRFAGDRIPAGVFTARLASLQNLQLEVPGVAEIEPGAFMALRQLRRLYISNLKVPQLAATVLQGLEQLRVLQLPDNRLLKLDANAFDASPRLESIDLRTTAAVHAVIPRNAFCGLATLQEVQLSAGSDDVNCTSLDFVPRKTRLMVRTGSKVNYYVCALLLGQTTTCGAAAVASTSAIVTTASSTSTSKLTTVKASKSTAAASTTATSMVITTTAKSPTTRKASASASSSSSTSTLTHRPTQTQAPSAIDPGRRPGKQATADGPATASAGPVIAVVVVAVVLLLVTASIAIFVATRRRRGVLRRAQSRQPIFSASGIDMQDSVWNPTFQNSTPEGEPEVSLASSSTEPRLD